MAQQVKAIATKPEDWSLIPSIHVLGGENQLHKLSTDLCICTVV